VTSVLTNTTSSRIVAILTARTLLATVRYRMSLRSWGGLRARHGHTL